MERMDAGKSIPLLREVRGAVGEDAVPPGPLKARENVHPLQEALLEVFRDYGSMFGVLIKLLLIQHDSTRQQFRELSRDAAFGSHFEMRLRMEQHMVVGVFFFFFFFFVFLGWW